MSDQLLVIFYCGLVIFLGLVFVAVLTLINTTERCFNKYIELEHEKEKNRQFELYANIDLEEIEKIVDTYFHIAELEYIKFHFTAKKISYITSAQQTEMIKAVSKQIAINLPESYLFYIKLLRNITEDEDLIKYIYERVSILSIDDVSEFNKAIE